MSNEIAITVVQPLVPPAERQAETDQHLISLWPHGRSPETRRAYRADAEHLLAYTSKTLRELTLADLQQYADFLCPHLAPTPA